MTFPSVFPVGDRAVGAGCPTYVIAEIGANHNRDLDTALQLIDAAVAAGADAVKFQTYSGARIYSRKTPAFKYLEACERIEVAERAPRGDLASARVAAGARSSRARARHRSSSRRPSITRPSPSSMRWTCRCSRSRRSRSSTFGLIERAAATGRPLLISTGMATLGEIEDALRRRSSGGRKRGRAHAMRLALPVPGRALEPPRDADDARRVRRSGRVLRPHHGIAVPIAAAALGAAFIEKHFTLDRSSPGT